MSKPVRVASLIIFFFTTIALAAVPTSQWLPAERQIREQFPSIVLDSRATLGPAQEIVVGRMVSGVRALATKARSGGDLRVFYPASYDEPFVVELGEQRVVLRAVGAHLTQAALSTGRIFYTRAHDSVDVIEISSTARSEELLVLHDARAPQVFEYEIVEMRGVAGLSIRDGAIRFAPDHPAPSLQIDRPWVIDANGHRSATAAQWTILEQDDHPRRIRLTIDSRSLVYPIVVDPSFSATGSMTSVRTWHTATLLQNGKVLIAGGYNDSDAVNTAELYDRATGTFTATSGTMTSGRYYHTATLLPNGKVLIAGGYDGTSVVNTAELYDPATDTFTATSAMMTSPRADHTATLLPNGKVLIAGGWGSSAIVNTAELYDPAAGVNGTFTATTVHMISARAYQTATLLPNGNVLIAGGSNASGSVNTAELYDPAAGTNGTFTATTVTMVSSRSGHTATLLANGKVLITGGVGSTYLSAAELYDPAAGTNGTFTATGALNAARSAHSAALLPNGKVLITGGTNGSATLNSADVYDPTAGTFSATSAMTSPRNNHTTTILPDGRVFIAGGYDGSETVATTEFFEPASGSFAATSGPLSSPRGHHTATLLPNGKVLIAGGVMGSGAVNTADLYDSAAGTFTATSAHMTSARFAHTATLLLNGKVLIAGGNNSTVDLSSAELYDPSSGTFTATNGPMISARQQHTAALLPNGRVLIVGGNSNSTTINTAELYDPASGTFTATNSMTAARLFPTAMLLLNGKVLIAAGSISSAAELYDPATGMFTPTGSMTFARYWATATLLPEGKVLIAGGSSDSMELYDPATATFTAASAHMISSRSYHTATLLPSGRVLIAGGDKSTLNGVLNTAEVYDPASGTLTPSSNMVSPRESHTATLLPNGKVLLASADRSPAWSTAELYDPGLGFSDVRRPVVSSLTNPLCQPANLVLSGSLFTGDSEGSSGSTNSSAANEPLLRLQRVDNGQLQFALAQSVTASSFFSATLSNLSSGHYRAAVVSNAIPSLEKIIDVETTPLLATYSTASVNVNASLARAPSSLPAGYSGALYAQNASGSIGFTGTLGVIEATGVVMITNAGPVGDFTITVSSSTGCGSPSTTFTLKVIGPQSSVTATAGTPQSTQVNTPFATALQATVTDAAGHPLNNITVNFTAPSSGASAALPGGGTVQTNASGIASITPTANGTLGSYNVTAVVGGLTAPFALTNTPATPTSVVATATTPTSVAITWNGTAGGTYEVLRVAAGSVSTVVGSSAAGSVTDSTATANTSYLYKVHAISPGTSPYGAADLATTVIFTDPSLVSGIAVKSVHIAELRTAVNAVRTLAGLGAGSYVDPSIGSGGIFVKAVHITDLRTALDAARSALLLPPVGYTRPSIVAAPIAAVDINDLRIGVR